MSAAQSAIAPVLAKTSAMRLLPLSSSAEAAGPAATAARPSFIGIADDTVREKSISTRSAIANGVGSTTTIWLPPSSTNGAPNVLNVVAPAVLTEKLKLPPMKLNVLVGDANEIGPMTVEPDRLVSVLLTPEALRMPNPPGVDAMVPALMTRLVPPVAIETPKAAGPVPAMNPELLRILLPPDAALRPKLVPRMVPELVMKLLPAAAVLNPNAPPDSVPVLVQIWS